MPVASRGMALTMAMCPGHASQPAVQQSGPAPVDDGQPQQKHHQAPCVFAATAGGTAPMFISAVAFLPIPQQEIFLPRVFAPAARQISRAHFPGDRPRPSDRRHRRLRPPVTDRSRVGGRSTAVRGQPSVDIALESLNGQSSHRCAYRASTVCAYSCGNPHLACCRPQRDRRSASSPAAADELESVIVTAPRMSAPLLVVMDPKQPHQPVPAHDGADYLKAVPGFAVIRKGGTTVIPCFAAWLLRASTY